MNTHALTHGHISAHLFTHHADCYRTGRFHRYELESVVPDAASKHDNCDKTAHHTWDAMAPTSPSTPAAFPPPPSFPPPAFAPPPPPAFAPPVLSPPQLPRQPPQLPPQSHRGAVTTHTGFGETRAGKDEANMRDWMLIQSARTGRVHSPPGGRAAFSEQAGGSGVGGKGGRLTPTVFGHTSRLQRLFSRNDLGHFTSGTARW